MILPVMFLLGVFALIAQMLFMRETLVVFFGNELSIGVTLGSWLIGVGLGAGLSRLAVKRMSFVWIRAVLALLLLTLALLLPCQVYLMRIARSLLDVGVGEYVPLNSIIIYSFLVFLPTCLAIGFFFPAACKLVHGKEQGVVAGAEAVSLVYALEALGGMLAGILLTYLLLPLLQPFQLVALACAVLVVAFAFLLARRWVFLVMCPVAACLIMVAFVPRFMEPVGDAANEARWRGLGVLVEPGPSGAVPVRLLASRDSIYQNVAITESSGQHVLYGNGQVLFVFPDEITYEHEIGFIMAQKPAAQKVLLLGGNPVGDLQELLKYGLKELVYVELDPVIGEMVRSFAGQEYDAALGDGRVKLVHQDAVRFVQQCKDMFDVVIINAPAPTTAGSNRFYTREFYGHIGRILSPGGFMVTGLTTSERLQDESTMLGASVYQTLQGVFSSVLVTAESHNRFFAGGRDSGLTFDRNELYRRSSGAGIKYQYFQPAYFCVADEIEPSKIKYVEARFSESGALPNTSIKPVAYFYNLLLWSRFSESGIAHVLHKVKAMDRSTVVLAVLVAGGLCLVVGSMLSRNEGSGRWSRAMLGVVLGMSGFTAMALEMVLIFVFQSLYGYVYIKMGFIVAVFMLGLVCGAMGGKWCNARCKAAPWRTMLYLEVALIVLALGIPLFVTFVSERDAAGWVQGIMEGMIFLFICALGLMVGMQFPLGNRLFCEAGGTVDGAAAVTDAADHFGAAIGCLTVGVVLVPVMGIGASCVVVAAVKGASILCLLSGAMSRPRG